ncbi:MAG: flagellin [Lautropia sp.]|nr:flagellin [Lautropia sp.]
MAQIINTNMMSLNAQRNLSGTQGMLAQAVQRLSTGLRVNSAKDDAAGLAIAERMHTQVRGMNVAIRNANDAISLAQTAEGALSKISDMGQRMRELAVQAANATNSDTDREALNVEYLELAKEIKRTLSGTKFNEKELFGTNAAALTFQIGAGNDQNTDRIEITLENMYNKDDIKNVVGENLTTGPEDNKTLKTQASAQTSIENINKMLTVVNSARATFGAVQNRFEAVINTLQVNAENQSAARSRIMDADFSKESAALTRSQVLQQAGTAMLSQANSLPNNALSLLR